MTDEEMSKDYAEHNQGKYTNEFGNLYHAYLAGLKAGKDMNVATKWHKVVDGDLPEVENHFWSRTVLLQTNKCSSIIGFYDHANKAWFEKATDA